MFGGYLDEFLWGCRHKLKSSKYNCFQFINKNTNYISEKYEPIAEQMCIRLNNLIQLKELRKYVYEKYSNHVQKKYANLLRLKQKSAGNLMQQFKIELCKLKLLNKNVESRIEKALNGLLNLLVFRVRIISAFLIQSLLIKLN